MVDTPRQRSLPAENLLEAKQLQLIYAPCAGEVTMGGGAGTGKTVALVYRAAQLCQETPWRKNQSAVLFLCFNRLLAARVQRLISSLPRSIAQRIEVRHIHRWCRPYLGEDMREWTVITDTAQLTVVREALREAKQMWGITRCTNASCGRSSGRLS
jgi:superfamily I DNA/RNA helicase